MTKSKQVGQYKIPFDEHGNQLDYANPWGLVTEVDNFEFEATLRYLTYNRGRSSATFTFIDIHTMKTVSFQMAEMNLILHFLQKGFIKGIFTFKKKGSNFTCSLVKTLPLDK